VEKTAGERPVSEKLSLSEYAQLSACAMHNSGINFQLFQQNKTGLNYAKVTIW
jgi:hypothetical protein